LSQQPEILRRENRDNFEVDEVIPTPHPLRQGFLIRRFHALETSTSRRIHPACMVRHAFRQHSTLSPESLPNGGYGALKHSMTMNSMKEVYLCLYLTAAFRTGHMKDLSCRRVKIGKGVGFILQCSASLMLGRLRSGRFLS
jgi:hypothetical protein